MSNFNFANLKGHAKRNSITIEWGVETDIPENELSQRVYIFLGDDLVGNPIELPQNARSYTIENLKADTEYYVYIQAYQEPEHTPLPVEYCVVKTEAGDVLSHDSGEASTEEKESTVIKNARVRVVEVTKESITIVWDKATDVITKDSDISYTVKWRCGEYGKIGTKSKIVDNTYTLTRLESGREYKLRVIAVNQAGNESEYPTVFAKTKDGIALSINDRRIKASSITHNSCELSWAPALDNVTDQSVIRYVIYQQKMGGGDLTAIAEVKGTTSYLVTGLEPGTTYRYTIRAYDERGNFGDYSSTDVLTYFPNSLSRPGEFYCDGVYPGNTGAASEYLYDSLASPFNLQAFDLSFDFYGLFPTSETSGTYGKNILMFGMTGRVFGLSVKDGFIYVSTNNLTNLFNTSIPYTQETWQSINLTYRHQTLRINGKSMIIGHVKNGGNNVLTSCDYSRGSCFKGFFRNIVLKSIPTSSQVILTKTDTFACNGIYQDGAVALKEDIGIKLHRKHFEISFDFYPESCDINSNQNNIITLNSYNKAHGLIMWDGGIILVRKSFRDGLDYVNTGITFTLNQWQHIDLVFYSPHVKKNYLTINGKLIDLGQIEWENRTYHDHNMVLSSLDYRFKDAFKGQFKNLVVRNM